jgi:hypothetical protein
MPLATSSLMNISTIKECITYFDKHGGKGVQVRLLRVYPCSNARVRNYFYKQGCKVSIMKQADGTRLIACNGFNTTGRKTNRASENKSRRSKRGEGEQTVSELLESTELTIGQPLIVKGDAATIRTQLGKKVGVGKVGMHRINDGYALTLKK